MLANDQGISHFVRTLDEALELSPEVAFHQAVRAPLIKGEGLIALQKDVNYELQQLLSQAVVGDGVTDIFKMAGLESPDISILSEEFLSRCDADASQELSGRAVAAPNQG